MLQANAEQDPDAQKNHYLDQESSTQKIFKNIPVAGKLLQAEFTITAKKKCSGTKSNANEKNQGVSFIKNYTTFWALILLPKSNNWKHPCDLSHGHVFLWTVPSQHVHLLNYFLMLSLTGSTRLPSPCLCMPHLGAFSFPYPPTPMPPPLICTFPL